MARKNEPYIYKVLRRETPSPRQQEFFLHILHRMTASDEVKRRLLHRLRIDGNTGNAVIPEHLQLFARDAVRTSRLNGKFNCLFHWE